MCHGQDQTVDGRQIGLGEIRRIARRRGRQAGGFRLALIERGKATAAGVADQNNLLKAHLTQMADGRADVEDARCGPEVDRSAKYLEDPIVRSGDSELFRHARNVATIPGSFQKS